MGFLAWLDAVCNRIKMLLDPFARLQPGQSIAQVSRLIGQPYSKYSLANGGQRWEYTLGPEGNQNYFVWFDLNLQLCKVEPLLIPENFAKIQVGMNQEQVRQILGPYFYARVYGAQPGVTQEWRYLEAATETAIFFVKFDPQGAVLASGTRRDPRADGG